MVPRFLFSAVRGAVHPVRSPADHATARLGVVDPGRRDSLHNGEDFQRLQHLRTLYAGPSVAFRARIAPPSRWSRRAEYPQWMAADILPKFVAEQMAGADISDIRG